MKHRLLAISRDRGSMQAIAPVIAALGECSSLEVLTYATHDSWPVIDEMGLSATQLDVDFFSANPEACIRTLFNAHHPVLILSGSSPARETSPETPEQFAILEAHRQKVPCIAIQDYWGMYLERFSRDGVSLDEGLLPDRLCVLDQRAHMDLLAFGVPANRLVITHNPWLDQLVSQTDCLNQARSPRYKGIRVLLASQPLAEMRTTRKWPYDQFDLFKTLWTAMALAAAQEQVVTLQVLPHPSENLSRWESELAYYQHGNVQVELLQVRSQDLLCEVDYLVTSHSTLAYQALYFGTPCISLRPTTKNGMQLWVDEIGLSRVFSDAESLGRYLAISDPINERQRVLDLKRELSTYGLFFSDGQATKRVLNEIAQVLPGHALRCPQ